VIFASMWPSNRSVPGLERPSIPVDAKSARNAKSGQPVVPLGVGLRPWGAALCRPRAEGGAP
jgi:hypothetical protein